MNLFGSTGQDRTAWMNDRAGRFENALRYYLGPTGIPDRLNALAGALQYTDAGDYLAAAEASQNFWNNPSIAAAGDYATAGAALAMPYVGYKMMTEGVENATDWAIRARDSDTLGAFRAWHGSPHDFDRFSMDKIGTGEGAQAYGHGLYFAENADTAKMYREALAGRAADRSADVGTLGGRAYSELSPDERAALRMVKDWGDPQKAADAAVRQDLQGEMLPRAAILNKMASGEMPYSLNEGRLYEVSIDADPEDFLDWDAPLSAQPTAVRDAVNRTARNVEPYGLDRVTDDMRAIEMKRMLNDPRGAAALREAGIPGIRYLDQGSRGAGDGTRNYVVFDDKLVSILNKYGLGAILGLGAGQMYSEDGS